MGRWGDGEMGRWGGRLRLRLYCVFVVYFERFQFEFSLKERSLEGNQTILVWRAEIRNNVQPCCAVPAKSWKLWLPSRASMLEKFSRSRKLNLRPCEV